MSNKIWVGTDSGNEGDWSVADNWKPISVRNATYKWTASGSGTAEYYCELVGGGDPSLEDPVNVQLNGSNATEGTMGSLTAGQWDYGDNDTLGYSTIYVRTSDDADPDSKAVDYVTFTNIPIASDNVYLEDSSQNVTAGFGQSAVTVASLNIAQSFTGTIGDSDDYLQIGATAVKIGHHEGPGTPTGSALIKLDLGAVQTAVKVYNTGTSSDSTKAPVRILGAHTSNTLEVRKGKVAVEWETGDVGQFATITVGYTTAKLTDSYVYLGSGLTLATLDNRAGNTVVRGTVTTVNIDAGTIRTEGTGTITTANVNGGNAEFNSTGTITTLVVNNGGTADFAKSAGARTISNLKLNAGGTLKHDPADTTITAWTEPDGPVILRASAA